MLSVEKNVSFSKASKIKSLKNKSLSKNFVDALKKLFTISSVRKYFAEISHDNVFLL